MKHEAYFTSPYTYIGIKERSYVTKEGSEITVNPTTGEMYTFSKIPKNKTELDDSLVYTKVFQDSIHQLCSLSNSTLKVLLYAIATVRPFSELVVLNGPDVQLFCGIGKSSFYDSVTELLDKKIISKKLGSSIEFWFDPNVFFNGNRVKVYKSHTNKQKV
jgi:hypothetical protein